MNLKHLGDSKKQMRDKIKTMFKRNLIIFFALFAFYVIPYNQTMAQSIADINVNDVSINTDPEIPEENQEVKITLSSFLLNLDNAKIEWKVDGKSERTGTGLKSFLITTGDLGKKTTVTAIIIDLNTGVRLEKNLIIEPSSIDILWEVKDSYVNNLYKGKALPVKESSIELTAIPNRKNQTVASQKNLTFSWKRNFDNIPNSSGFSKQSFSFKNDYLKEVEKVEITARDNAGTYISSGKIDLVFYNPIILFYQKKDGLGIDFWNALNDGVSVGQNDFNLIAEPFFITPKNKNDVNLKYIWKVNGTTIETPAYKSYIIVRGDGGSGVSNIQLEVSNLGKIFQKVTRSLNISVSGN